MKYYIIMLDDKEIGSGEIILVDNKSLYFSILVILAFHFDCLPVFFDIYAVDKYDNSIIYNKYYNCFISNIDYVQVSINDNFSYLILDGVDVKYEDSE